MFPFLLWPPGCSEPSVQLLWQCCCIIWGVRLRLTFSFMPFAWISSGLYFISMGYDFSIHDFKIISRFYYKKQVKMHIFFFYGRPLSEYEIWPR